MFSHKLCDSREINQWTPSGERIVCKWLFLCAHSSSLTLYLLPEAVFQSGSNLMGSAGVCLLSGDVITYNGTRRELSPLRNRTGDIVDVWFQTGVPSADFEIITTSGSMLGVGCVNRKTVGDTSPTCSLCVTASASGGGRRTLACAAADAVLSPDTVYRLTIQLSQTVVGTILDAGGVTLSNVSAVVSDHARGELQVLRPVGPGYVCVRQIQVANPTACSSNPFASFNGDPACCTTCDDTTAGCSSPGQPCACPVSAIATSNISCGEARAQFV
jgi:hypothetical protein